MLQRLALEIFHDDEHTTFLLADVVYRADVGVIQRRSRPRLALKASQSNGIVYT